MRYITSVERIGIQQGRELGLAEAREAARKEGFNEGFNEGIRLGKARMFQRLIGLKFGTPDDATAQRIQSASQEDLERWLERLLTAGSLEELLA